MGTAISSPFLACLSSGLLIADEDLLTGDAASAEVLVRPSRLGQRDPLGHDGLDLPLREELEQRGGVLLEPSGMTVAELGHLERSDPLAIGEEVAGEYQRSGEVEQRDLPCALPSPTVVP